MSASVNPMPGERAPEDEEHVHRQRAQHQTSNGDAGNGFAERDVRIVLACRHDAEPNRRDSGSDQRHWVRTLCPGPDHADERDQSGHPKGHEVLERHD